MTDGDALYRAIVARPEDDTPRLVYADWLEENGHEEEAEFIRLECRLEASTPDLPEWTELMERREELRLWLQTHAPKKLKKKLAGGLSMDEESKWWMGTCRGFPRYLTVKHTGGRLGAKGIRKLATSLEKAFEMLPTRSLFVGFEAIEDLAEFLKQPVLEALDHITISVGMNEQIGDDAARLISDCRQLRSLRSLVLDSPVGEIGAGALSRSECFGRIEAFVLNTFQLTPGGMRTLGSGRWFRDLRELTWEEDFGPGAFDELCRLPSMPRLHTLHLPRNRFPVSSWQAFASSKTFPQLTRLLLRDTDMSNGQMQALAAADGLRLTSLDLARCSIGNEGVGALVNAPFAESLQWLDLSSNRLGPLAARTIAKCGKLLTLKHLALAGNPIAGSGLKAIAGSPNLHNLISLQLGERAVGPRTLLSAACHEFLEKLDMPKLRHLSLSGLPIDARSVRLLSEEKFHNLTRLGLANCKLTDTAIPDLLRSPALQRLIELNLHGNSLKTGVMPLTDRRILPQLSVCSLSDNLIAPDIRRKLARRPGVIVSNK